MKSEKLLHFCEAEGRAELRIYKLDFLLDFLDADKDDLVQFSLVFCDFAMPVPVLLRL